MSIKQLLNVHFLKPSKLNKKNMNDTCSQYIVFFSVRQLKYILKEKNNALRRLYYLGFVHLDKFIELFQLADKKKTRTKIDLFR